MYQSFFSYNVTRPYPYRWFTWLVVLGGIAATALFTVVNLAANGYEPSVFYANDPNITESPKSPAWFQKRPWSLTNKVTTSCQSQEITVGKQLYTSNFGFPYKVDTLYRDRHDSAASFVYHNDQIHACEIESMGLSLGDGQYGSVCDVTAKINCTMYEQHSTIMMLLTLSFSIDEWGRIEPNEGMMPSSLPGNARAQASIFWGRIMSRYYANLLIRQFGVSDVLLSTLDLSFYYYFGAVIFSLKFDNHTLATTSFPYEMPLDRWSSNFGLDILGDELDEADVKQEVNVSTMDVQGLLFNGLAKSLYSTILTDLGQSVPVNIFSSPQTVVNFAEKSHELATSVTNETEYASWNFMILGVPASSGVNDIEPADIFAFAGTRLPRVDPATISMRYLCQVPKLKSTGSLLISIIVADLVLLQVLWRLLNWITTFIVERRHPEAMYCAGHDEEAAPKGFEEAAESVTSSRQSYMLLPRVDAPLTNASNVVVTDVKIDDNHNKVD